MGGLTPQMSDTVPPLLRPAPRSAERATVDDQSIVSMFLPLSLHYLYVYSMVVFSFFSHNLRNQGWIDQNVPHVPAMLKARDSIDQNPNFLVMC